jgi:predicted nucleotidyltransferase
MPIPESQLETWSHQGAVISSSATYRSIQTALAADSSPIKGKDYEVYLQGSYKNDTNIRGDSDVDVVVQLNATFGRDLAVLPENQKRLYEAAHSSATYLWDNFRKDVLQALRSYYGTRAGTALSYEYENQPRPGAVKTMEIHFGTARLVFVNGRYLDGYYYSGRGRQEHGSIHLERVQA